MALIVGGTAVDATAAELNIMDGVTSTAAELNIMAGVTSTAAELNELDGFSGDLTGAFTLGSNSQFEEVARGSFTMDGNGKSHDTNPGLWVEGGGDTVDKGYLVFAVNQSQNHAVAEFVFVDLNHNWNAEMNLASYGMGCETFDDSGICLRLTGGATNTGNYTIYRVV